MVIFIELAEGRVVCEEGQNEDHQHHRSAVDVGSSVTGSSVTQIGNLSGAF